MSRIPTATLLAATTALTLALPALASPEALTPVEARHLVARTGFGAAPHEIAAYTGLSRETAVARILSGLSPEPSTPMPVWTQGWDYPEAEIWSLGRTAEDLYYANRYLEIEELAGWWMAEMVATPSPLTERLTLFWHDHFATSFDEVENPQWMAAQNRMFRTHAAGNFADLAAGILRDPAMLVWLDNVENYAENPNENLAREYLELFTLGQGNGYTEADVKEVARALTGHGVHEWAGSGYAFHEEDHDGGQKAILGQIGRFDATDLPQVVLGHPDFGPYIVEKLWLAFVSDNPDPSEITRLTELWKASDFEIKPLLEAMFLTEAFWDPANRGRLVKSPVELAIGTVRSLGMQGVSIPELRWATEDMGQALFFPPNVAGWTSGTGWITDAAALSRATIMTYAVDYDRETVEPDTVMMADASAPVVTRASPDDLRIGQSFLLEAAYWDPEEEEGAEGMGAVLTLFDVSFAGETWRSVSLLIEEEAGGLPSLGILPRDCSPACLYGADWDLEDGEGWVWLWLEPEEMTEMLEGQPDEAVGFLASLSAHLPEIIESTQDQITWDPDPEENEESSLTPPYSEIAALASRVADAGAASIGAAPGTYVQGLSAPNTLGLAGLEAYADMSDPDQYFDDRYDAMAGAAAPAITYPNAAAWVAALPAGMTPAEALLAVPLITSTVQGDAQDVLETLLLAPEYQLN